MAILKKAIIGSYYFKQYAPYGVPPSMGVFLFADLNKDGSPDLAFTTYENGLSDPSPLKLFLGNSAGLLQDLSALIQPGFLSFGTNLTPVDFNNDGLTDLLIQAAPEIGGLKYNTSGGIDLSLWGAPQYILMQSPSGSFSANTIGYSDRPT